MSLVNSEWLRLIRQFAEMALDLEATKEDIRHEYHAWFAKPTINPRSYMDNEIFSKGNEYLCHTSTPGALADPLGSKSCAPLDSWAADQY